VWLGTVSDRGWHGIAKTAGNLAAAFAENLRPGGRRTSVYSIQILARRHPGWYRSDLATLLGLLTDNKIAPHIAAVHKLGEAPTASPASLATRPQANRSSPSPPADSSSTPPTSL
jgi:hypothetical protein